jgi:hypothetical protein
MNAELTLVQPRPQPLGWYVRAGYNDHLTLSKFVEGGGRPAGVVLLPEYAQRHESLRGHLKTTHVELILETHALEQGFVEANRRPSLQALPWRTARAHTAKDLNGIKGAQYIRLLVDAIATFGYDAVLAPSHYLAQAENDPWFRRDLVLAARLRRELDKRGLTKVRIYYRVAAPAALLREDHAHAQAIASELARLDIDAVWLLLHPFGDASSGVVNLNGYMRAARAFHRVGRPVVAERVGAVGLLLQALGAIAGSCSGMGYGEQFDVATLSATGTGGYGPPPRIYLNTLMAQVPRDVAEALFKKQPFKALHTCGRWCCPNGVSDTLRDTALHFAVQREAETLRLSGAPQQHRANVYITEMLSPATRYLVTASNADRALKRALDRTVSWGIAADGWIRSGGSTEYNVPPFGERYPMQSTSSGLLRVVENDAS